MFNSHISILHRSYISPISVIYQSFVWGLWGMWPLQLWDGMNVWVWVGNLCKHLSVFYEHSAVLEIQKLRQIQVQIQISGTDKRDKVEFGERGGFITWEVGGQLKEEHSISVFILPFLLPTCQPSAKADAKRPGCIPPLEKSFKAFVRGRPSRAFKLL